jgi:membrane protein
MSSVYRRRLAAAQLRFRGSWLDQLGTQLKTLHVFDWTSVFGAELLWSVLPLFILLSSLANHSIENDVSRHIGLDSQASHIVRAMFRSSPSHDVFAIVTGLLLSLTGTIAVVGSIQVLYERLFHQEHRGWRDTPRLLVWVVALLAALAAQAIISGPVRRSAGPVGEVLVRLVAETLFFWWTMHFLLAGRVGWGPLIRPAVVTGILWLGLAAVSSLFFSSAIVEDSRDYGTIGVIFTFLTWFVLIGAVLMLGAAAGATWLERRRPGQPACSPLSSDGTDLPAPVDQQPMHHEDVDHEDRERPERIGR